MARVYINIEDVNDFVGVNFVFEGGFNAKSNAHQHALMIQRWLDANMVPQDEPQIETVEVSEGGNTD